MPVTTTTTTLTDKFAICETLDEKKEFILKLINVTYSTSPLGAMYLETVSLNESWEELSLEEKFQILSFVYRTPSFDISKGFLEVAAYNASEKCLSRKGFKPAVQHVISEMYEVKNQKIIQAFWHLAATTAPFAEVIPDKQSLLYDNEKFLHTMLQDAGSSVFDDEKLINSAAKFLNHTYIDILLDLIQALQLKNDFAGQLKEVFEIISNDKSPEAQDALARFQASLKEHQMEDIIEPNPEIDRGKRTRYLLT